MLSERHYSNPVALSHSSLFALFTPHCPRPFQPELIMTSRSILQLCPYIFSDILLIFIFRKREKEGERKGEKHQCVVASHTPPTGDLAGNPGSHPGWESNLRLFSSQASTQSTEPHQPEPAHTFLNCCFIKFSSTIPWMCHAIFFLPFQDTIIDFTSFEVRKFYKKKNVLKKDGTFKR
ncbi:hypothetical protein HJG60_011545 [Phyllostomus discolor]|uniref:Uncharacterized protein n=1 Tax=Phyllostomus discolor TaxID=89673 RepID=A0A834E0W8_9CHIR|nr:hypothetical protein HJG60_011545 [Phyllostomus discolor]